MNTIFKRLIIFSSIALTFIFWYTYFHYLRLVFVDFWSTLKSVAILGIPVSLSIISGLLLLFEFKNSPYVMPYLPYFKFNRLLIQVIFVILFANFGIIYTINLLGKAVPACFTAADIVNDPYTPISGSIKRCFMLYENNVYNHQSGNTPDPITKRHQNNPCQTSTTTTSGTIYDATNQINSNYTFHKTSTYVGNNARAYVAPLCTSVIKTLISGSLYRISDPVIVQPTPTPTPTRSPSPAPTKSPSPIPTRSPSPTPFPTRSPSPSPSSSIVASVSPTPAPNLEVSLQLAIESITSSVLTKPELEVLIVFRNTDTGLETVFIRNLTSNQQGIYILPIGIVNPILIPRGNYQACTQTTNTLQRCGLYNWISPPQNIVSFDLTNLPLLSGNSVDTGISANKIDIFDFNNLVRNYNCKKIQSSPPPGKLCNSFASDFDFDGDVDIHDYNFFAGNFGKIGD